jgi:hypothetical protein
MANPTAGLQVQFTDGNRLHVHIVTHFQLPDPTVNQTAEHGRSGSASICRPIISGLACPTGGAPRSS